jgi:hypothetical protein
VVSRLFDQGNFLGTPKKQVIIQRGIRDLFRKGVNFSPVQKGAGQNNAHSFPMLGQRQEVE